MLERSLEAVVILVVKAAPLNLAQCRHTRKEHILEILVGGNVLCPEVGLNAENMLLSRLRNTVGRIALVNVLDREIAADGNRFNVSVL